MNGTSATQPSNIAVTGAGRIQGEREATMTRLLTTPTLLLRLESAALLAVGLLLYWKIGGNWIAFALLLLVPDASMVGYVRGNRIGATVYNLVHLYLWPSIMAVIGILMSNEVTLSLALIWFSHINMDRSLGYGLKLPSGFKHTHLDTDQGQPVVPTERDSHIDSAPPVTPT